jgi:hypothetical protein
VTGRERTLALVTGIVLGVGGAYGLLLEPAWTRWQEADEQALLLEDAVAREREQAASLDRVRAEREALEDRLGGLASGQALVPAFLAHVRALTRQAGFEPGTLRSLGARPLVEDGKRPARDEVAPFAELSFELRARTTLERLTDFLVRLAAGDKPVRVAGLSLTPRQGATDLEVEVTLVALAPREALDAAHGGPR